MEGGYFPWKLQNIKDKYPDPSIYGKPLPPPPSGFYWQKNEDNTWQLHRFNYHNLSYENLSTVFDRHIVLDHVILEGDTLPGICLKYGVSAVSLRRANYFSGNNIKGFKSLRIPVEPGVPVNIQFDTHDVLIQKFRNISNEGKVESRIYLEESDWDLNKALVAWSGDESWMTNHLDLPHNFSDMDDSTHDPLIVPTTATVVHPTAVTEISTIVSPTTVRYASAIPVSRGTSRSRGLGSIPARDVRDPATERLIVK